METSTDILIIGGGIAGCIAAIALADTHKVTIIDKLNQPTDRIGESLAPAAQRILKALDLWQDLVTQSETIFINNLGMQSYWGSERVQIVDHLRNPDGFVKSLNRKAFETYLRQTAEKRGVHCLWNTKFYDAIYKDQAWEVTIQSNTIPSKQKQISAAFIIDASGRQSHFARHLGIKRHVEDKLIATWVTLPNTKTNTMSTISASESGWWYSAVIPNNKRVVAYHTDSDLVNKKDYKTKATFLKLAQSHPHISELVFNAKEDLVYQGIVAANSTKLKQVSGANWAAIGDAALSFDPLSSQGMFNAMANAMQLKDMINTYGFDEKLTAQYQQQIESIWQHYLKHKSLFYKAENRWKKAEFWKRRSVV